MTLLEALQLEGENGAPALLRNGAAGVLDAATKGVDYSKSLGTVIRNIEDGLDPQFYQSTNYGDDNDLESRKNRLKLANEAGCPPS